jgi:Flp pilus assembly protein TadD
MIYENIAIPVFFRRFMLAVLALSLLAGLGGCADVSRVRGYEAFRKGDYAQAREHFEECVRRDATDWKSHYYLGRIALDSDGDPYYARRHLDTAETIRKSLPESQLAPKPGAPQQAVPFPTRQQIADALAESMYRQGLRERLFHYLRQQADEYGSTDDYLRMARYMAALGDRDGAELSYKKAGLIADPTDARPHLELADFYDSVGDRAAALIELRKAYYIDPTIKGLADNIRAHGMVPGPTVAIAPEREKPKIVRPGAEEPKEPQYPASPSAVIPQPQ